MLKKRWFLALIAAVIALSYSTSCETTAQAASSSEAIFTINATLSKGAAPTQFRVYETMQITGDGDSLYQIEYTLPDGLTAAQALLFPCATESELVPLLRFVDVNFDGHLDIEALRSQGATNVFSTYFINNGQNTGFREEKQLWELSDYQLFPQQRLILNKIHDSYLTSVWEMFRWNEDGSQVFRYRTGSLLYDDNDPQVLCALLLTYDGSENATTFKEERYNANLQESAYQPFWDERSQFLWEGLHAELPLSRSVYVNPHGGKHYHASAQCQTISQQYWDDLVCLQRGQLFDAAYAQLTPCKICCPDEQ